MLNKKEIDTLDSVPMGLDNCQIETLIQVNSGVATNPKSYFRSRKLDTTCISSKTKEGRDDCVIVMFMAYGALVLILKCDDALKWWITRIKINIPKVMYGHNGAISSVYDVLRALSVIIEKVEPLLAFPEDRKHIIPGIDKDGIAFWKYLELVAHVRDPDHDFLYALSNARHPAIRSSNFGFLGESVKMQTKSGKLGVSAYDKTREMWKLLKKYKAPGQDVFTRAEVILKGKKLLHYLAMSGNSRSIGGKYRIDRFTGSDLVAAHRRVMGELKGCFVRAGDRTGGNNDKTGRMMALVAKTRNLTISQQLKMYERRFPACKDTLQRIASAAFDEYAGLCGFDLGILGEEAYSRRNSIAIPDLESLFDDRRAGGDIDPGVWHAYGPKAWPLPSLGVSEGGEQGVAAATGDQPVVPGTVSVID